MDDQEFDEIIKRKLNDYEDRGFDPGSLAALHRHLPEPASGVPWYTRYHHQVIISATVVLALLLLGTQWYWNRRNVRILMDELSALKTQIGENATLEDELNRLRNLPPDTVRIIEVRDEGFTGSRSLLLQYRMLESEVHDLRHQLVTLHSRTEPLHFSDSERSLSGSRGPARQFINPYPIKSGSDAIVEAKTHVERKIPAAMSRELEKHYQKGVGIRVGPALDLSRGNYSSGQGQFAVGYGLLGDLILSPSISVEVGAKYFKRYYEIAEEAGLAEVNLPGVNGSGGLLRKAEVDNWMIDLPIAIKYRHPLSPGLHALAAIGYSTSIYMNQVFEYDYQLNDGSNGDFVVHSIYRHKATNIYPGTLNLLIGVSNRLKNGKSVEAMAVYQQGLGVMGIEKNKASYLGIRTAYWFTLK